MMSRSGPRRRALIWGVVGYVAFVHLAWAYMLLSNPAAANAT
jgi:hypothetical protein